MPLPCAIQSAAAWAHKRELNSTLVIFRTRKENLPKAL